MIESKEELKKEAIKLYEEGRKPSPKWEEVRKEKYSAHALLFGGEDLIQALVGYRISCLVFDIFIQRDWNIREERYTVGGEEFSNATAAMIFCELVLESEFSNILGETA